MISVEYIPAEKLEDFTKLPSKEIAFLDILDGNKAVLLTDDSGKTLLIVTSEWAWISEVTENENT